MIGLPEFLKCLDPQAYFLVKQLIIIGGQSFKFMLRLINELHACPWDRRRNWSFLSAEDVVDGSKLDDDSGIIMGAEDL